MYLLGAWVGGKCIATFETHLMKSFKHAHTFNIFIQLSQSHICIRNGNVDDIDSQASSLQAPADGRQFAYFYTKLKIYIYLMLMLRQEIDAFHLNQIKRKKTGKKLTDR